MPTELNADVEKSKVIEIIENILGTTYQVPEQRKYWRTTASGRTFFYVLFSKENTKGICWYGLRDDHFATANSYSRSFFIFVVNQHTEALIIPCRIMHNIIVDHKIELQGNDEYHLHIRKNRIEFTEAPKVHLKLYHNNYASLVEKTN